MNEWMNGNSIKLSKIEKTFKIFQLVLKDIQTEIITSDLEDLG